MTDSMAAASTQPPQDLNDPSERATWRTANEAAEKFCALFYRSIEKHGRPDLPGFYTDSVTLLWNGNRTESRAAVVDYLSKLPRVQITLHSVSAQPIQKSLSRDKNLVMVTVFGTAKFTTHAPKLFSESFFLVQEAQLWRVQSQTFRFIE